jgi:uncharacterized protein YaiE (UPF0345 family)
MKFTQLLEGKIKANGFDTSKLGEDTLAKLNEVEIDDTLGAEILTAINGNLISRLEAENQPDLFEKYKDKWHKEARKAVLDSLDASMAESINALNDEEVQEYNLADGSVKKNKYLLGKLKEKIAKANESGASDADKKALEQHLAEFKDKVSKDYVPKTETEVYTNEIKELKKSLKKLEETTINDHIGSVAVRSGILNDTFKDSELLEGTVLIAVNKYLETEAFGESTKGKIVLENGRVYVRNDKDASMSIVVEEKILTVDELVKKALIKYNLHKKSDDGKQKFVAPLADHKVNGIGGEVRKQSLSVFN